MNGIKVKVSVVWSGLSPDLSLTPAGDKSWSGAGVEPHCSYSINLFIGHKIDCLAHQIYTFFNQPQVGRGIIWKPTSSLLFYDQKLDNNKCPEGNRWSVQRR